MAPLAPGTECAPASSTAARINSALSFKFIIDKVMLTPTRPCAEVSPSVLRHVSSPVVPGGDAFMPDSTQIFTDLQWTLDGPTDGRTRTLFFPAAVKEEVEVRAPSVTSSPPSLSAAFREEKTRAHNRGQFWYAREGGPLLLTLPGLRRENQWEDTTFLWRLIVPDRLKLSGSLSQKATRTKPGTTRDSWNT